MPAKKITATGVDADSLRQLKDRGAESLVLDARLEYTDSEGIYRYVADMATVERVHPDMMPTQASGRWSTTGPPLPNFPPELDDVIIPDLGTYWVYFDLDAIEAKIAAAYAGDREDLEAFNKGYDVHTITTCRAYKHPLPPILTKKLHTDPSCEPWWKSWTPEWGAGFSKRSDDRRRHLMKTMRYALQYGEDEYSALNAKDVEKLGLDRDQLLEAARAFLRAKPALVAIKRRVREESVRLGHARTFLGRRRRLYGAPAEQGRMAWALMVSGSVVDMMNIYLNEILNVSFPQAWLIKHGHDSLIMSFPIKSYPVRQTTVAICKGIVEREWVIGGNPILVTAGEWKVIDAPATA